MGKSLLLLRHGKSDWREGEADFDRGLAKRGRLAAVLMGQYLDENDLIPDAIVTSPAVRALSTAEIVQEELDDIELIEDERIYEASIDSLLDVVNGLADEYERVLLVGHNPGFEELADELSGRSDSVLKTCSLAILHCGSGSWSEVAPGGCKLQEIVHPAEVAEA
ncbi:MAG: histidine phosphatase family protein [bacterium]|nr:histidine phosphatase family protein [bacterium]